jgi:hypothetical protein
MTVSLDDLPRPAAESGLRLRDELLAILGDDLVGAWLHGGTTFADRPTVQGDVDICAVISELQPTERVPAAWRADPGSRPARIQAAQVLIAREYGVELDAVYLPADEVGGGEPPSRAFDGTQLETGWAVYRAHWLAGQYVLLHGQRPEDLVVPPTPAELRGALDRELEHLERHVHEGDASDPFEATYGLLNGCRILRTLETGSPVISKRSAGIWGIEHLPQRWHAAIDAAIRSYDGAASPEDTEVLRVAMAPFVDMARQRLPATEPRPPGPPRWS